MSLMACIHCGREPSEEVGDKIIQLCKDEIAKLPPGEREHTAVWPSVNCGECGHPVELKEEENAG